MKFKEFLILHLQIYFVLVTLIFAASMIVGVIVTPDESLRYYQLIGPFVEAGLCLLPSVITYFKTEPTLPQYIFRHIIQLSVIEGIIIFMTEPPADSKKGVFYFILGVVVFIIYFASKLIVWLQKYRQSKKLTEQLKRFQASVSEL